VNGPRTIAQRLFIVADDLEAKAIKAHADAEKIPDVATASQLFQGANDLKAKAIKARELAVRFDCWTGAGQ
jgi:hypothetical protein